MNELRTDLKDSLSKKLAANPSIKTAHLAETLGVTETELLRNWPNGDVAELDSARIEDAIRALESLDIVYVVVRNASCVMEIFGSFGGYSRSGPYLNVSTETLHLHLLTKDIVAGFAVNRPGPSPDSRSRSFQFFDSHGASSFKVFLMTPPGTVDGRDFAKAFESIASQFVGR